MIARLLRIAWSNLWRNPRRTAITVSGLALGVIMLAFSDSLMAGIRRDLIEQGTRLLLGHVQIHARNYRPDRSIFDTIPGDGPGLAKRLRQEPDVLGAAPRAIGYGLISAGENSAGADLLGVVPELEAAVSTLSGYIVNGRDLKTRDGSPGGEVVIGQRLASTLAVVPGDRVVILTQGADGSLGNDVYSVAGVFRTGIDGVDGGLAVMTLGDLHALLALAPERVHEIAIRTSDPATAPAVASRLARLAPERTEVVPWPVLAPQIGEYVDMSEAWMWLMYLIVLALAAVAVLNTMLMAVFERFREFGVLAAVGMRPLHIVVLVAAEVAALAAVALAVSVAAGWPLMHWLVHSGIDLQSITSGIAMSGVALSPVMRGAWTWQAYVRSAALLIGFALLTGLYPAVRAARVNPAALTRGEMR